MIPTMLLMLAAGIGLAQAASNPHAVTLPWLRLGGVIAVTVLLLAVASEVMAHGWTHSGNIARLAAPAVAFIVQLMAVQLAYRHRQRFAAAMGFLLATLSATVSTGIILAHHQLDGGDVPQLTPQVWAALLVTVALSSGILGAFLMTMLLGHAYLTAGNEMTQSPFRRLVLLLAALLALRLIASLALGLFPWLGSERTGSQLWVIMTMTARYAVGFLVTGAFVYMTHDCVKRRANQSATGILYVAGILVIIGEWSALSLLDSTGFLF